jgi:inosine-uridine nucleoside N-ribohydrolase
MPAPQSGAGILPASSPLTRRSFFRKSALLGAGIAGTPPGLLGLPAQSTPDNTSTGPTPVILATDIGDDIDDTWALGLLLKSPELDLKLVMTEYGKAQYRAKLLAKFLQTTGHARVPIGIGPDVEPFGQGGQAAWVEDYDLRSYPGSVHSDGIQALVDALMQSSRPITLICIGPMPNVAAALAREPRIAQRARLVGMDGSVRLGYDGSKTVSAEWNVKAAVKAARQVLSAPWEITITPLDTCGLVRLDGARYRRVVEAPGPVASAIIQNYRLWSRANNTQAEAERRSSVLFDTVAVYLAFSQDLCSMERLGIRVSEDGYTLIDPHAKPMNVATGWKSLDRYRDLLVQRLTTS